LKGEPALTSLRRPIKRARLSSIAAILLLGLQLCFCCAAVNAQEGRTQLTTQGLAEDTFLARALYSVPDRMASNIGDDGALGVNRGIGSGERMYIEEQRYGGDLVQTGLAIGDHSLVKLGLKVIDWGFRHQAEDGSFPQTGDAFHSVSMFVEGAARAFISLREAGGSRYADVLTRMTPRLIAAARWLEQPDVERTGRAHDAPYTHRRWILAAALGQTAALAHDTEMASRANKYAEDGLSLQQSDGVNPEKGGYDVSYQAVGVLFGERYFVVCHDNELRSRVERMIERALNWELAMITNDGQVLVGDSTRIENEKSRSGKVKHVNTKELLQALSFATTITGDKKYRDKAALVAHARGWY
jgi:hypothetical protein